jgi:nitrate/nitrite transporter NarK
MGFDAVLALFAQATFHWNSTAAGLLLLAVFVPGFVSPAVGALADRYDARLATAGGFAALVPPLVCLRFVTANSLGHKVLLAALLAGESIYI